MSCINDVRLVGRLTKDPEFAETSAKKRFARLSVETEKFVRVNGESRRIAQVHQVVCFNQFALQPLQEFARKGTWVKVLGELSYDRNGKAEVVVAQYSGEVGLMSTDLAPQQDPQPSAQQERAPAQTRSTGGLGRLSSNGGDAPKDSPRENDAPPRGSSRALADADLDDDIPF